MVVVVVATGAGEGVWTVGLVPLAGEGWWMDGAERIVASQAKQERIEAR